ncbi:hypothetical protein HR17_02235 [Porphyromonas gulae]|uniref:hypothetical protein n=1 Tax=Porphyromonas gulae TaxID=111105 RepID=UPI00052BF838|nr:hypothetical protein [Porphyromonas gulae]KGN76226.1 hypothetical protein HR17_02235 [Porphyromonas gulae]KGO04158.1 hypothetical protein HR16_07145 [Porphyromonas gulae]
MEIIRGLFQDIESLHDYLLGLSEEIAIDVLERRLRLIERERRPELSDHYYIFQTKREIEQIKNESRNIGEFILKSVSALAMEYLEERRGVIFVRQEKFLEWQELVCYFSPLFLMATFIYKKYGPCIDSNLESYIARYIAPNVIFSALPSAYIPELNHLLKEKEGFYDLHIHLNGTMESDWVWADMITNPSDSLKEVHRNFTSDELVKEHFAQIDPRMNPTELYSVLEKAQKYRKEFISHFMMDDFDKLPLDLRKIILEEKPSLVLEMLIYIKFFSYIGSDSSPMPLSSLSVGKFHFYLLAKGLVNMLLVHQPSQFGFRQFQKITSNDLRWYSEKSFNRRFFQLSGNSLQNISVLEGRFSPKKTEADTIRLIQNINKGWKGFIEEWSRKNKDSNKKPKLYLVAHFIKKQEKIKEDRYRYETLRSELSTIADSLCRMKKNQNPCINDVVGIDAAASEFDTPPEVFAPIYHQLRGNGFNHFTYHAGEDFIHIVSGLRAIFEAIYFLGLERGDRIGHCAASGSDAALWLKRLRGEIYISQGDYLSDCLFVYYLITQQKDPIKELYYLIPNLTLRIEELSENIYNEIYTVDSLVKAWICRRWCPKIVNKIVCENKDLFDDETQGIKKELDKLPVSVRKILNLYNANNQNSIPHYNDIISIDPAELFDDKVITALQKEILRYMHRKEIVIETLPTSNLRIGFYDDFSSSHLWNWLKWKSEGCPIPPIVVGTDDAGIFATNIYNEYASIYCYLVHKKSVSHKDAMRLLREFDENAAIYHFH